MATSQNGWRVYTSSAPLQVFPWVTGRLRPGDVFFVFDTLCRDFHNNVEPIRPKDSWGYAYRPVRGQTTGFSNHASATAVDLNATTHPMGRANTFTPRQISRIRIILARFVDPNTGRSIIRWGGDFRNRPDDMHFEINQANAAAVARVVRKLKAGTPPTPTVDPLEAYIMTTPENKIGRVVQNNALARLFKMFDQPTKTVTASSEIFASAANSRAILAELRATRTLLNQIDRRLTNLENSK